MSDIAERLRLIWTYQHEVAQRIAALEIAALEADITRLHAALDAERERCAKVLDARAVEADIASQNYKALGYAADQVRHGNCRDVYKAAAAAIRALPPPEAP